MTSSKIRCFLAIDIEPKLIANIKTIQEEFKKTNADIKYVPMENIHFTLKFFGDISEESIDKVSIAINNVIKNYSPFEIAISGSGAFPNEDYIKVIWIGISKNSTFINLQNDLDNEFKKLGFKKEKNYTAHLTIGRMKSPKNKKEVKNVLDLFKNYEIGFMKISNLSLKSSQLTSNRPIYSEIANFEL